MTAAKPIVTDLKTATANALKAEATGAMVTFVFDGESYEVPSDPEDIDIAFLECMGEQDMPGAMKVLVGEDAYKRFRIAHRKIRDMKRFLIAAQAVMGGN